MEGLGKYILGSFALVQKPVWEKKENSEFKQAVLRWKIDHVSRTIRGGVDLWVMAMKGYSTFPPSSTTGASLSDTVY